eukprot:TRINITY_DN12204_c0_g1_i1.p1 TRINITY_DN12204_c0_g1~~TRINITY_DN12204_c0_g1_i1.p1  ORF type:complete len:136 (-),score=6.90 TRINITY_DN12204_c0_g1_i1:83-436(-)
MRNLLIFLVMLGSSIGQLTTTYDKMTVDEIIDPIKCKNNGKWAGQVVSEIACRSTSFTCQLMLAFQYDLLKLQIGLKCKEGYFWREFPHVNSPLSQCSNLEDFENFDRYLHRLVIRL